MKTNISISLDVNIAIKLQQKDNISKYISELIIKDIKEVENAISK